MGFIVSALPIIATLAAVVVIPVMYWQSKIAPQPKIVIRVAEFEEIEHSERDQNPKYGLMVTITNRGQLSTTVRHISIKSYQNRLAKFRKRNPIASLPWRTPFTLTTAKLPVLLQPGDYWSGQIYIDWLLEKAPGRPIYVFAHHTFSDHPKATRVIQRLHQSA
ncbi:hypothetical protein ABMA57_07580 [Saccharospirillum sp. HFRX-1]|uniref:hypothetical protein n=1 Tax=unclassified Saccharospirillum TaxID=2633430 RepID=UPI003716B001